MSVITSDSRAQKRRHAQRLSVQLYCDFLRIIDWFAIVATGLLIYLAYPKMPTPFIPPTYYQITLLAGATVTVISLTWFGAYRANSVLARNFPAGQAVIGWLGTAFALLGAAFALKISDDFSRVWAVSWFAFTPFVLISVRLLVSAHVRRIADQGRFALRTVIFGAGEYGQRLVQHLKSQKDPMIDILGFVDDRTHRVPRSIEDLEVLGNAEHLIAMIRNQEVDQVLVALPWAAKNRLDHLIGNIGVTPVSILLAPDVAGFLPSSHTMTTLAHVPMVQVTEAPFSGWSALTKELEDRLLACLFLLLASPILATIAVLIKLDSKGPVIFKQRRYGYNNEEIQVWKFRSMYTDMCDVTGTQQATKDDPRVTRVGRFLRKTSLDELPQLFNVLFGEMSIVGPRPHAISTKIGDRLFSELVDRYDARHRVKPGITGWAQVNGWRGETDTVDQIKARVEHDLYYIENWSVWLDLVIIIKTVMVIWKDKNAY